MPRIHRILPATRTRAAENRREPSHPERVLWTLLRRSQLNGLKFRRQYTVGPYIADFCCPSAHVLVEVDGESHVGRLDYDQNREQFLKANGYRVVRITNDDVLKNLDGVAMVISQACGHSTVHVTTDALPTP